MMNEQGFHANSIKHVSFEFPKHIVHASVAVMIEL